MITKTFGWPAPGPGTEVENLTFLISTSGDVIGMNSIPPHKV
jgi:hypothetical protein